MTEYSCTEERSLKSWYRYGRDLLAASGITEADSDARILLEYAANIDRSYYYLHMNDPIDEEDAVLYASLLHRRTRREPVQYITGEAPFYGSIFHVTPDVLIPRQDTEILVEEAEKRLLPGMLVLDLCTGSGCILLSLLKEHSIKGIGSDISDAALKVAEENRKRLKRQATWIRSDLFSEIGGRFDMIVSNPPYIAADVLRELEPEVIDHEPVTALDGGNKGMEILSRIISEAPDHLYSGGWLLVEIGYDQGTAAAKLFQENHFEEIEIIKDLGHHDRVAAGRRP